MQRGVSLLRRKRESVVRELLERARPAVDSRRAIEQRALEAYRALLDALSSAPSTDLRALGWPTREVTVELTPRDVWGIRGVVLAEKPRLLRSFAARGVAAGGPNDAPAVAAADQFELLLEQLLAAAPEEVFIRRLGEALSHVTRLVNTLEQRVSVSLDQEATAMQRTLEEREREEHLRLKRFARRSRDEG